MTNEEAFEKWLKDNYQDYPPFPQDVWEAAIAYMQEQSEPVAEAIRERDRLGFAVVNVIGKLDEIIENTQEIEVDDYLHIAVPIDMWNELQASLEDMPKRADLYNTPQRDKASLSGVATRQPLKRLSDEVIDSLAKKGESWNEHGGWYFDADKFANAIMDAMQELNK